MTVMTRYKEIIEHYEKCLEKHGDNHLGVDWPKPEDVDTRYSVMLDILKFDQWPGGGVTLLDFGCGGAHLLDHIKRTGRKEIAYSGLDASPKFIQLCKGKHPDVQFIEGDALDPAFQISDFDYVVMNGVFTEKRTLSFQEMWDYFELVIMRIYPHVKRGLAFNVMTKNVDWERDDLFHVPVDALSRFITTNLSRHFVVRHDYGLFEYTVYVLRNHV